MKLHWISLLTIIRISLILLTLGLLSACVNMQPQSNATVQNTESWQARQIALNQITHWQAQGALAIQTDKANDSLQFDWNLTAQNQYRLRFIGPIGTGYGTLQTTPTQSIYFAPKNKTFQDSDAQTLLAKVTGWSLPVDDLYYWARGLPAPHSAATLQFDDSKTHLSQLQQDGFTVDFIRYTGVNTVDLPSKILISNADLKIKIVLTQWRLD